MLVIGFLSWAGNQIVKLHKAWEEAKNLLSTAGSRPVEEIRAELDRIKKAATGHDAADYRDLRKGLQSRPPPPPPPPKKGTP